VNVSDAVRQSQVVLSVCPPHAAVDVAQEVAAMNFRASTSMLTRYLRATAEEIGGIVSKSGAVRRRSIIGSPVKQAGTTRLYLSGERAEDVARLFAASMLDAPSDRQPTRRRFGTEDGLRCVDKSTDVWSWRFAHRRP